MTITHLAALSSASIAERQAEPPPICSSHQIENPSACNASTSGLTRFRSSALYETNTSDIERPPPRH